MPCVSSSVTCQVRIRRLAFGIGSVVVATGGFSYARLPADADLGESNGQNLWALSCIAQDWPATLRRRAFERNTLKNLRGFPAI